jgi:hypothetical protein
MAIVSVALRTAEAEASQPGGGEELDKRGTSTSTVEEASPPDWAITADEADRNATRQQADTTKFLNDMMLLKLPVKMI